MHPLPPLSQHHIWGSTASSTPLSITSFWISLSWQPTEMDSVYFKQNSSLLKGYWVPSELLRRLEREVWKTAMIIEAAHQGHSKVLSLFHSGKDKWSHCCWALATGAWSDDPAAPGKWMLMLLPAPQLDYLFWFHHITISRCIWLASRNSVNTAF